jgi:hypothetical protein
MEKTNWIEKISEFIRQAMNKGLTITAYQGLTPWIDERSEKDISFNFEVNNGEIFISFFNFDNTITINTKHGLCKLEYKLSERDILELNALVLSVKEYKEDMALSEFNNFFKETDTPQSIDNLDDDD